MRRLLLTLLLVAGLCDLTRADTLAPRAFTAQFARALQAAMPTASIVVARELRLTLRRADGSSVTLNLGNAYRDYSADPARFNELVRAHAAAHTPAPAKLDRTRIVPLIKDRKWLAELQTAFRRQDAAQQPVFDDLNEALVVVYAEDSDNRTRYLSSGEDLGVARSELRALAVANLLRILPKVEMRQHDDAFSMLTSHADYGASMLLIDHIWSSGQIKVDGEIVVAAPAKDVLLVTGSRNAVGLDAVRRIAQELAKGRYGLIDTLFVYRGGRFVVFGGTGGGAP